MTGTSTGGGIQPEKFPLLTTKADINQTTIITSPTIQYSEFLKPMIQHMPIVPPKPVIMIQGEPH